MNKIENFTNFEISKDKNKWHLADYANLQVKNILESNKLELKNLILIELDKENPNLKLLTSPDVINILEEIFDELLEEDKKDLQKILDTKNKDIKFDFFIKRSKFSKLFWMISFLSYMWEYKEMFDIFKKVEIKNNNFYKEKSLSIKYFNKIQYCFENEELDEEQKRILKFKMENMKSEWVHLSEENHKELKKISEGLTLSQTEFRENVNKWYAQEFYIKSDEYLQEFPEGSNCLSRAKERAEKEDKEWFIFTLSPWDYVELRQYISNPELRAEYIKAFESVASETNKDVLPRILELKNELAIIRWSNNFSELTSDEMFLSWKEVGKLILQLWEWLKEKSEKDINEIKKEFNLVDVKQTDYYYYERKLKEKQNSFNNSEFEKYFEYENVRDFMFNKIWGAYRFSFKVDDNVEWYDEWVENYKIYEWDKLVAYLVFDMFKREWKKNWANAWYLFNKEVDWFPYISLNWDIQKWENKTLLSANNVGNIMFHEFWHLLHLISSESKYSELCWRNNLPTDVMEFPSNFLEISFKTKEMLMELWKHFETGNKIPQELVDSFLNSSDFGLADADTIQLVYSALDRFLHSKEFNSIDDLNKETLELINKLFNLPKEEWYKRWFALSRILAEWYWWAYYSYLVWPMLVKAAFSKIKNWFFDEDTISKFKNKVLKVGSMKDFIDIWIEYFWKFDIDEIIRISLEGK